MSWNMTSDFLLSASLDQTLRVWHIPTSKSVRVINNDSSLFSCAYHPLNNNIVFV